MTSICKLHKYIRECLVALSVTKDEGIRRDFEVNSHLWKSEVHNPQWTSVVREAPRSAARRIMD